MGIEVLERRFAAIGARLNVVGPPGGAPRIDVGADARGEFFDVRFAGSGRPVELEVVDVDRADRHLLLLVRDGREKSKFLCGHDERARPKDPFRRRNAAYVRQGEWFFVPALDIDPPSAFVLRNEPLSRGRGKAHMIEHAYRRGGEVVWVNRRHPTGISDVRYRRLTEQDRRSGGWTRFARNPELFATGAIRHADHATVVLHGWHRVVMNTEQGARAMRHVAFLD
jgi:hypothetical protein